MSTRTRRRRRGRWTLTVAQDVTSFVLAWLIIFQQLLFVDPSRVNPIFVGAALTLLGVPGGEKILTRILERRRAGTGGSASEPASPASRSSFSSSGDDE